MKDLGVTRLRGSELKNISIKDIEAFEEKHNLKLPQSYVDFLLKYNGGSTDYSEFNYKENEGMNIVAPELRTVTEERPNPFPTGILIEYFLPLHLVNVDPYSQKYIDDLKLPVKRETPVSPLVFIAVVYENSCVCISTHPDYYGKIYFWDHRDAPDYMNEDERTENYENIFYLCDSFEEFCNRLEAY